ncbi:MAG: AarF/ABC1/UbiB kinase family protein, partial [Synechococcales cyanobacterium T60_A2020_003]|nr:AarF/ABC1/UbiB kinase family protein [Synechococcales cyanobacterium T60_A2020_003]
NPQTRTALTEMMLAIVSCDAQRCAQLTLQLAEPMQPVDLLKLESEYSRLLSRYYNLSLSELNTAEAFSEILHAATRNHLRWPSNIGLFTKSLANLEGAARQFNPSINVLDEIRPLMTDLFRQQLVGDDPLLALLRAAVEFRNLSLESPRQLGFLLERLSMETQKFNIDVPAIETLSRTVDEAANRRSLSTLVGALVVGAAIASTQAQVPQLQLLSEILFAAASFIGLWLIVSIWRSGDFGVKR